MIGVIAVLAFFALDLALVTAALLWLSRRRAALEFRGYRPGLWLQD